MLEKIKQIEDRYEEINQLLANPEISKDHIKVRDLIKEQTKIKSVANLSIELGKVEREIQETNEIIRTENDKDLTDLAKSEMENLKLKKDELELQLRISLIPDDPNNEKNVIMEIRAGTGGDEAALFGSNLLKMYSRYSEIQKWDIEILSLSENDIGGCKEASIKISGNNVFGRLKFESGVHRVQRIPLTETQGRIHTSAATVAILPVVEEVDIDINVTDLRIDTYRAQGAGGQHVNKTESAVRITHIPTGTVTQCQDGKSQHKNKAKALEMLRAKLYNNEKEIRDSERSETRKLLVGSGDRSERIRTYNYPQDRITDHRIQLSLNRIDEILSGNRLNEIIDVLLAQEESDRLSQLSEAN